MSIQMIATVRFSHRGRLLDVGTPFTASPVEAAAYIYQRIATYHTETKELTAEAAPPVPVTRRRYRRRDLTAEESS